MAEKGQNLLELIAGRFRPTVKRAAYGDLVNAGYSSMGMGSPFVPRLYRPGTNVLKPTEQLRQEQKATVIGGLAGLALGTAPVVAPRMIAATGLASRGAGRAVTRLSAPLLGRYGTRVGNAVAQGVKDVGDVASLPFRVANGVYGLATKGVRPALQAGTQAVRPSVTTAIRAVLNPGKTLQYVARHPLKAGGRVLGPVAKAALSPRLWFYPAATARLYGSAASGDVKDVARSAAELGGFSAASALVGPTTTMVGDTILRKLTRNYGAGF